MSLGLGVNITTQVVDTAAELIADYFWELVSAGNLAPLAAGTVSDFHDTWDLDDEEEPPDITPQIQSDVGAEGYWDIDGSSDIQPLDV